MAGGSCESDAVTSALGATAGVLLAICLMPQLWKMAVTKSAKDISYGWTAFYFAGLVFYLVYLIRLGAVVGYVGIAVEMLLVLFVVGGKAYLEHVYRPPLAQLSAAAESEGGDMEQQGGREQGMDGGAGAQQKEEPILSAAVPPLLLSSGRPGSGGVSRLPHGAAA